MLNCNVGYYPVLRGVINLIDKDLFKKTEGRLYRHYRNLKEIEKLKSRVVLLWKQKEQIEQDIRTTNVKIDYYQSGMALGERVQTSSTGTSYAEREIISAIDKLEKELIQKKKKILKLHARIREKEEQIADMDYNIQMLNEEHKRLIEWKYGENKSLDWIATEMYAGARTTAYRKREEIVESIAQWCNISERK